MMISLVTKAVQTKTVLKLNPLQSKKKNKKKCMDKSPFYMN